MVDMTLGSKHLHGHIQGNDLQLSKFEDGAECERECRRPGESDRRCEWDARAAGVEGERKARERDGAGQADWGRERRSAQRRASCCSTTLKSTLVGAQVAADGQTDLTGNFQTQAKLTLAGLDVAKAAGALSTGRHAGDVEHIAGTVTVSGPGEDADAADRAG